MNKNYITVEHQFGTGQTVYGVLKYYNNNMMSSGELALVETYFIDENGSRVRRAGDIVKVPVLRKYQKE